jgi:hypothetical protein
MPTSQDIQGIMGSASLIEYACCSGAESDNCLPRGIQRAAIEIIFPLASTSVANEHQAGVDGTSVLDEGPCAAIAKRQGQPKTGRVQHATVQNVTPSSTARSDSQRSGLVMTAILDEGGLRGWARIAHFSPLRK